MKSLFSLFKLFIIFIQSKFLINVKLKSKFTYNNYLSTSNDNLSNFLFNNYSISDIKNLINNYNVKSNSDLNSITQSFTEIESNINLKSVNNKNSDLSNIIGNNQDYYDVLSTDNLDISKNISQDDLFNQNDLNLQDKEIERKQGLNNGHILYNGRRTLNIETGEFADYYYELQKVI